MKFNSIDKRYLNERKLISEKYGQRELWSVIDHWAYIAVYRILHVAWPFQILCAAPSASRVM